MAYTSIFGPSSTPQTKPYTSIFGGSAGNYKSIFSGDTITSGFKAPTPIRTEDNPSVLGFLGNVVGDVGEIAQGVTSLAGMAIHDIAQTAKVVIPGQQPGEAEGFQMDDLVKALPGAIASDYAKRYGSIGGFLKSLYEDPLAFVGDVLIAGAAIGKGAQLGGKVGLISEELASTIAGPGTVSMMSMTGSTEPLAIKVAYNPVTRLAQNKLMKLASVTPDMALELASVFTDNPIRALNAASRAEQLGIRVLTPGASQFVENRAISRAVSILGLKRSDIAAQATRGVQQILKDVDTDEVIEILHGSSAPLNQPAATPLGTFATPLDTTTQTGLLPVTVQPEAATAASAVRGLTQHYSKPTQMRMTDVRAPHQTPVITPMDRIGEEGIRATVFVDSFDNPAAIAVEAENAAAAMGGRVVRVQNAMNDPIDGWYGYSTSVELQDGTIAEVSIATPDLYESQVAWSNITRHEQALSARVSALEEQRLVLQGQIEDLQSMGEDVPAETAAAYEDISEAVLVAAQEARISQVQRGLMFDAVHRQMNATATGTELSSELLAADRLRPYVWNRATDAEISRGSLTWRDSIDRAFGPQRSMRHTYMMASIENELRDFFQQINDMGASQADSVPGTIEILERWLGPNHPAVIDHVFHSQTDEVLRIETDDGLTAVLKPQTPEMVNEKRLPDNWWGTREADVAAARVTNRLRHATYESIVANGEFPTFTWEDMLNDTLTAGLPVPQYYPHIKSSKLSPSQAIMRSAQGTIIESTSPRMKRWMGYLYETGRFERDPVKAYSALFRQIANGQEFRNFMEQMVSVYGRPVSQQELADWKANQWAAERLVSRKGMKQMVDMRGEVMYDVQAGLLDGKTMEQATIDALQALHDRALDSVDDVMLDEVWAIPKAVAEQLDRQAKLVFGQTFDFYYNGAMNMWKSSVLGLSPRWLVNNSIGNLIYMGIRHPGAIRHALAQLLPSRRAYAKAVLGDAMTDDIARGFVHIERMARESEMSENAGRIASWGERVKASLVGRGIVGIRDRIYNMNEVIEQAARRGVALEAYSKQTLTRWERLFNSSYKSMQKMARVGIDDQASWARTLTEIDRTLGDYLVMTPFERNVVRKYISPFYAFYRHTAKFVVRMPFEHPIKAKVLMEIEELEKEMNGERPYWLRGAAKVWETGGLPTFVRLGNANPLQAVTNVYGPNLLNPVLSLSIQRMTGTTPFGTEWQIPAGQVVTTHNGSQYEIIRNSDGQMVGIKPVGDGKWQPPLPQAVLSMVPQFGLLPGVDIFGRDFARKALGLAGLSYSQFDVDKWKLQQLQEKIEAYTSAAYAAARYPA